jgi:hypothetical protein
MLLRLSPVHNIPRLLPIRLHQLSKQHHVKHNPSPPWCRTTTSKPPRSGKLFSLPSLSLACFSART